MTSALADEDCFTNKVVVDVVRRKVDAKPEPPYAEILAEVDSRLRARRMAGSTEEGMMSEYYATTVVQQNGSFEILSDRQCKRSPSVDTNMTWDEVQDDVKLLVRY